MATQSNRAMISETSICNQALSWVGANAIESLESSGKEAEWCRDNYPALRDAVLESRMWTFATVRAASTTADSPVWGDLYEHAVPLDWLSVYRVYCDEGYTQADWRREGRFVLADSATVYMWGVKRIVDTGYFSPLFVQALAARLAADMAIPFTENRQLQADMWALFESKLREAAARDGAQGRNEQTISNTLIDARR